MSNCFADNRMEFASEVFIPLTIHQEMLFIFLIIFLGNFFGLFLIQLVLLPPYFWYFPVCIRNELTPSHNFVMLILCAGFLISLARYSSSWILFWYFWVNFSLELSDVLCLAFSQSSTYFFFSCCFIFHGFSLIVARFQLVLWDS